MPLTQINNVSYWFESKNSNSDSLSNKPAILMIHGFAANRTRFDFLWNSEEFSKVPMYRLDLKGHGESQKMNIQDYTLDSCVEEISYFIEEVIFKNNKNKKLIIIAHSMGGIIAQKIAINRPEYLKKLVLMCTVSEVSKKFKILTFLGSRFFLLLKNILKNNMKKEHISAGIDFFPEWAEETKYLKPNENSLKHFLAELNKINITEEIHRINVPTLIIGGNNDNFSRPKLIKKMEEQIDDSRSIIFKETAHFPYIKYKNDVLKLIHDFLFV
jgi:3-oxoadipate enol-lactonase